MKLLAKLLLSTNVSSLIKSKGSKKSQLITLPADATIRTALMTFITQDISAIPIRADTQNGEIAFLGMFNIVDVLKYILKDAPESFYKQDIPTLLNQPISAVIKECGIRKIKVIREQLSLMRLLYDHWGGLTKSSEYDEIDKKHLLVNCGSGKYDVVTPTDLLRYVLLLSKENGYLRSTKACEIPCEFVMDESKTIKGEDDAWMAFKKLLQAGPSYVLAVVDRDTGKLEAHLSAIDFIPLSLADNSPDKSISLENAISMLRRPGLSLYAFVRATKPFLSSADLDPVCLQPHFTLADLIEKMAMMKIHQLWRVSQDRARTPLGIVGICDVISHFCKVFEPYCQDNNSAI